MRRRRLAVDWYAEGSAGGGSCRAVPDRCAVGRFEPRAESAKRCSWLQMAADAGQSDAQAALANYLVRTNTAEGFAKAQDLLEKATASGSRGWQSSISLQSSRPDRMRRGAIPNRALELLTPGEERTSTSIPPSSRFARRHTRCWVISRRRRMHRRRALRKATKARMGSRRIRRRGLRATPSQNRGAGTSSPIDPATRCVPARNARVKRARVNTACRATAPAQPSACAVSRCANPAA